MLDLRPVPETELEASRERLLEHATRRRMRLSFQDEQTARETASQALERSADDVSFHDVVDGDRVVGWLAWWHKGDQGDVNALVLDEPGRAAELVPALERLARGGGAAYLGASAGPGEPAVEALFAGGEFVPRATNMALDLAAAPPGPGDLELRGMTQDEFDSYLAASTEQYIGELAAAGMSDESAREQGERQMAELVPNGLESEGQVFFTATVDGTPVGVLWLSVENPMAFVYDIEVHEDQRRKGYGEAIMNAAAGYSRDHGHAALGLNVFAHNPGARALYDKLGYQVTADYRSVELGDAG